MRVECPVMVRDGLHASTRAPSKADEDSPAPNGEPPLVRGASPVLSVDIREHAHYIDDRNARLKYLEAFTDELVNR